MRDKTAPEPIKAAELTIVGANRASWADLQTIFGTADYPGKCYCQGFKTRDCHWSSLSDQERRARLREQTHCERIEPDHPLGFLQRGEVRAPGTGRERARVIAWPDVHNADIRPRQGAAAGRVPGVPGRRRG